MKKIEITVRAYASIAKRYPEFSLKKMSVEPGKTVSDIISKSGISKEEIGIIVRNNLRVNFESVLVDGDILKLFPPLGGGLSFYLILFWNTVDSGICKVGGRHCLGA